MSDYDAIVIGSGIGGLAAAALLARLRGLRVLVLEKHFRLGGFTHEFERHGYRWDVGVHYVGGMGAGGSSRPLMDLITGGELEWTQMPEDFEVFHYPGLQFRVPSDPRRYRRRLTDAFPDEARAIKAYFRDVARAASWYGMESWSWNGGLVGSAVGTAARARRRLGLQTTERYLARRFADARLRALVASQWGDYGLTPSRSAFAVHALIVQHYLQGGWFPRGGSEAIAAACRVVIESAGGHCRVNHEVRRILIENGRAVGVDVHVRRGRGGSRVELHAPVVISDAGAHTTYTRLLPEGVGTGLATRVAAAEPSMSAVTVYLGLSRSASELGMAGENHWFYTGFDHERVLDGGPLLLEGQPSACYLSFPSLKDPDATRHTAEIISFAAAEDFSRWTGTRWMRRGADYLALKKRLTDGLIGFVDDRLPGFADLVDHVEVSTPLTVESFTGHRSGAVYGLAGTPERLRGKLVGARGPVDGLLITGADACCAGIMGAVMGGVFAAGAVIGAAGVPRIMAAAARTATPGRRQPSMALESGVLTDLAAGSRGPG
jgi:phytoene dehydrogenase-like protein